MRHKTRPDVAALRGAPSDDSHEDVNRTPYPALCPKWKPEAKTRVKCGNGIDKRYFVGRDGRLHTKRGWGPVVKDVSSGKRHAWRWYTKELGEAAPIKSEGYADGISGTNTKL
jgi:hypothetical protein